MDNLTDLSGNTAEEYAYDEDGNVTGIDRNSGDYALTYNTSGQVTAVAGDASVSYVYDANGNRTAITDSTGRHNLILSTTGLGLSAPSLMASATGALESGYVYGDLGPTMRYDAAGNATYYLEDAMGSVIGLTGAQDASFRYDGYGNLLTENGQTTAVLPGDFRFQGQWLDNATSLYNMRARTYDPQTGRFTSRDPQAPDQRQPESYNKYAFANGNPIVFADPMGRFSLSEISIGQAIDKVLESLDKFMVARGRAYAKDKITEFAGTFLKDQLMQLLPFNPEGMLASIEGNALSGLGNLAGLEGGVMFEQAVKMQAWNMKHLPLVQWLWFEPKVDITGNPRWDGLNLSNVDLLSLLKGVTAFDYPRPDFIASADPPTWDNAPGSGLLPDRAGDISHKSWITGEFKLSQQAVYASMSEDSTQWQAIVYHASLQTNHQHIPLALYFTLRGGPAAQEAKIVEAAAMDETLVIIISLR